VINAPVVLLGDHVLGIIALGVPWFPPWDCTLFQQFHYSVVDDLIDGGRHTFAPFLDLRRRYPFALMLVVPWELVDVGNSR
jgi:hypothetical protein